MTRVATIDHRAYLFAALAFALSIVFAACGGGGGGAAGIGSPVTASGTITKGSIKLDGLRDDSLAGATIRFDDRAGTEAEIRDGMRGKIKAHRRADDPLTPEVEIEIEKIEVEPEVRGRIDEIHKTEKWLKVAGQTVFVDDTTHFEDRALDNTFSSLPNGLDDLAGGEEVEIHGGRDDSGRIRASRVERRHDDPIDEVMGTVAAPLTPTSFKLANGTGTIDVNYSGAAIRPAGVSLALGLLVELHGSFDNTTNTFTASIVDIEDLEDDEFKPAEGEEFEVEGFISGFTGHPGVFSVGGRLVETSSSTRFEGGGAEDLANNVEVEAEGHFLTAGSVLRADKIRFKRSRVRLQGEVTAKDAGAGTLVMFGRTIQVNSLLVDGAGSRTFASVGVGDRVEMRGFEDNSGAIHAERLDDANSQGGDDIIRARVTAEGANSVTFFRNGPTFTVTTVNSGPGATVFRDENDSLIDAATFYASVVPRSDAPPTNPGTLVKVRMNPGSTAAKEAEIED